MDPKFITPVNKSFNSSRGDSLVYTYGEDFMAYISFLKDHNTRSTKERLVEGCVPHLMLTSQVVEMFSQICSSLSLFPQVKYIAMEIFDRFVTRHYCDVRESVKSSSQNPNTVKKKWMLTLARMQKQTLLRILTSIQIASKVDYQPQSVGLDQIVKFLAEAGLPYQRASVARSEFRVFRTLEFTVPLWSPHTYVCAVFEGLQSWCKKSHNSLNTELLTTCEEVLDFTTLRREEVYLRLFSLSTKRWERSTKERTEWASMELDNFLLATAVVLTAVYILPACSVDCHTICMRMSELTDSPQETIAAFSLVIIELITGKTLR